MLESVVHNNSFTAFVTLYCQAFPFYTPEYDVFRGYKKGIPISNRLTEDLPGEAYSCFSRKQLMC